MTVHFRIDSFILATTRGDVTYRFNSDLTVLAGPTGVGKTTLLELIKFGFGGSARIASVARDYVLSVTLEISIGDDRWRITRSLDPDKSKVAQVTDLVTRDRLPDHNVSNVSHELPSLNALLMTSFGLPVDMRAAASGNSVKEGNRITFLNILTYMYVPQYEINRDIARSQDVYLEPKRRIVFELLFGLTDAEILAMRSRMNKLKGEIDEAERNHRIVLEFLRSSGTVGRLDASDEFRSAEQAQREAEQELDALRETVDPVTDRETQVLRDLLAEAEYSLTEARTTAAELARQQSEYVSERRRVQTDLERLGRMRDAGERLAEIEFVVCPRCMQSLERDGIAPGACRLCLQPDVVLSNSQNDQYETRQLDRQIVEMNDQLDIVAVQLNNVARAIRDREQLVSRLASTIDARTADRVTPRLQAYGDISRRIATAKARQEHLETILRQWDRVADLESAVDALRGEREQVKGRWERARDELNARRNEILDEISEEFRSTVQSFRVPDVKSASVHRERYLPVINGKIFSEEVQLGGGRATAIQVAYWSALLAVGLRHRYDCSYPAFLLMDSPRLALNTATDLTAALYRRLVTQADANPGRVQIIVADNELPGSYRGDYAQFDFDYGRPTISSIEHPGPASVVTIGDVGANAVA